MWRALLALAIIFNLSGVIVAEDGEAPSADAAAQRAAGIYPFGVAWGFLYGYEGAKAQVFLPQLHKIGTGFTKVYLFWNQIEPKRRQFDWSAVDSLLNQLQSGDELLISIFCSSEWGSRRPVAMLPPSPARNLEDYEHFIHELVAHCNGRVKYWQNDCEPNDPVYWSGSVEDFLAELTAFHRAVKDADPNAIVVAGGFDGLFNPPGMWQFPGQEKSLAMFGRVIEEDFDAYDLFDLRLYGDPYTIVYRVHHIEDMMSHSGHVKPIICCEYNGPGFYEFPANITYVKLVTDWSKSIADSSTTRLAAPDGQGVAALYQNIDQLAPQTQMFMMGCAPQLDARLRRMQCRDLVMRNMLALSAGVRKTLFWDLWHDASDKNNVMTLMYGKLKMMDKQDDVLGVELPVAGAFLRMTQTLAGIDSVKQIEMPDNPTIFLFEVRCRPDRRVYVVWQRRDAFGGEDEPPIKFAWPAQLPDPKATDALGNAVGVTQANGQVSVMLSNTPIYVY
jgi:hypothetical protein